VGARPHDDDAIVRQRCQFNDRPQGPGTSTARREWSNLTRFTCSDVRGAASLVR
jgi:hypothetical protein